MILNLIAPSSGASAPPVTITWKNFDGSIIDTTQVKSGETPTHDDPEYDIPFKEWSPMPSPVTEDTTYVAQYTLPEGMSQTIDKSWDEIITDADAKNTSGYNLLDTKMMFMTDGKVLCFELAGKDVDTLADGSGKAPMTWVSRTIDGKCQWNTSSSNSGGYPSSNYKTYLEGTCLNHFPSNIKNAMKNISKVCHSYSPDTTNMSYTAKVWPPNMREMNYGSSSYETSGAQYTCYTSNSQRIRYDSSGTASSAWLSSAYYFSSGNAMCVNTSGEWGGTLCSNSYGALPCFCLGKI